MFPQSAPHHGNTNLHVVCSIHVNFLPWWLGISRGNGVTYEMKSGQGEGQVPVESHITLLSVPDVHRRQPCCFYSVIRHTTPSFLCIDAWAGGSFCRFGSFQPWHSMKMEMALSVMVVGLSTLLFSSQICHQRNNSSLCSFLGLSLLSMGGGSRVTGLLGMKRKCSFLVDGIISFFPVFPEPFMAIWLEECFLEGQWHAAFQ